MKKLSLIVLLAIAAPAAFAQSQSPQSVKVPGYNISAPERTFSKAAAGFDNYRGAYDLSNGQVLSLMAHGASMFAQLDDGDRHELAATGYGKFVAKDLSLKITLERKADGDVGGEMLIAKSSSVAGQPMEYVRIALR
ncbi:hypothetical protein GCM10027277_42970 [Pseudoduganella ginsengisoli]|uniref:DUF3471 domain-containing protein n=1 Tax=Pseudoduganella ginsengisoli TaxID=1462440 RepID=A0A6L6Q6M8_9BURK|nr:hypothetical protein [Pseudoduganella ginsengisoli]MTW05099.1 hypothetical protein [Pseudoduganella ginsengisoli]